MMKLELTYEAWLHLADEERQHIVRSWDPYAGEGQELLREAGERFREAYGQQVGVRDIHWGLFHGGTYIIGVSVEKGSRPQLPATFDGFPVVRMTAR